MSKKYFYFILLLAIPWHLSAQYEDLETKYDFLHNFIIQKKVKSITEYYFTNFKGYATCSKDSAKILSKQEFDTKGRLLTNYDGYVDSIPRRLISYQYKNNSNYTDLTITTYDVKGKILQSNPWKFKYDAMGKRINAVLNSGNGKQLNINFEFLKNKTIELSWSGTDSSKNSAIKWELFYDNNNRLIKKSKYFLNKESENLIEGPIIYQYNASNAIATEETRLTADTSVIYDAKVYSYDKQNRLIKIVEKKKSNWNCATCKDVIFNYVYTYNEKGALLSISKYKEDKTQPVICWFYCFEYY